MICIRHRYSIDLTFANSGTGSGFEIYTASKDEVGSYTVSDRALYVCADDKEENNQAVYQKIISGTSASYAVKGDNIYVGDDVSAVQRNITLYVYDDVNIPAIMVDKEKSKLLYVDDSTGTVKELQVDESDDGYGNYLYTMTADEIGANWYSLTFSVPVAEFGGAVCKLYKKTVNGETITYTWSKDFVNNETSEVYEADITPVFSGSVYYKDGVFSSEKPEVVITLGMLKELVASKEVTAITEKGESNYTVSSWNAFKEALDVANALITTYGTAEDTTQGADITTSYTTLQKTINGIEESAIQRSITLYVYDDTGVPVIMSEKKGLSYIDAGNGTEQELTADEYNDGYVNFYYSMEEDETSPHWYYLTFVVPTVKEGDKICQLYQKTGNGETIKYTWVKNFMNGEPSDAYSVDMTPVFSGKIYYKDGVFSEEREEENRVSALEELISEAEKYVQSDYMETGWAAFAKALADAKAVAAKENPTNEEIEAAVKALTEAMAALIYATEAEVNVQKVLLSDDFITGADLSSYVSLVESGVVFKDENGNPLSDSEFFEAVAAGGTNWIRIRLWDNPYDSNGNGYGGGNNDIDKAITLAKLADGAGMKVLLDFHYSDFWVDPSKYAAPKAWENMTLEEKEKALYDHTYNSLVKLHDAGVDVGMVQVGNETNSGIAGETDKTKMARLFNSGSKAVRDFSENYLGKRDAVMVALHFTDPQDGYAAIAGNLDENGVDYDVFASSYYPYWHESHTAAGDTRSLTEALEYVAATYGKKVMVAETSWATTWEDGDGHDNSAPKTSGQNLQYDISVQGQVDEMRAVVAAVNSIPNGIGVFYWEPAWIPVGYAYNDDGSVNQEQLKTNRELWEKYGSGWASSYSAEYDPNDAGKWYGGSAVDNQSWFDFDGTALASLNAYRYMRSGTSAKLAISYVPKSVETSTFVGGTVDYPAAVQAKFNNGTTADYPVVWDSEQKALVSTDKVGEYYVDGMVTCTYEDAEQKTVTEKYVITLTIKVQPMASSNQLENAGFEIVENDAAKGWTVKYVTKAADGTETESTSAPAGSEYTIKPTTENPYSGSYGMNFYRGDAGISIRVCQEITGLDAGTYDFGGYIQGGSTGGDDLSYSYVKIYSLGENGERVLEASYKSECALSGWLNWSKPEVSGFALQAGQIIEVGFEINSSVAGSWGSIDDAYLYGSYGVGADPELKNGVITLSDTVARVGEMVRFVVTPDDGYVVDDKDISIYRLEGVNQETKIPVTDCDLEVKNAQGAFIMPGYPVYVTAKIKSIEEIAGENADSKINLNDVNFAPVKAQIYTGKDIKPSITAAYKTYTLTEKKDYTLEYTNNREVGTATIKVTGTGNFAGTKEITFDIKKATSLKDAQITISGGDSVDNKGVQCFLYTGDKIYADVKVEAAGTASGTKVTLKEGEDYILSFSNNTKVGTATVYIVANENNAVYSGSVKKTFKIVKPDLGVLDQAGAIVVTPPSGTTYTGKAVKPNITIKYGTMTLRKGVDYTVSYSKNKTVSYNPQNPDEVVAAGVLTVKGKGSFTGKFTREFKISPKSLSDANVKATAKAMTYKNGSKITPSVSVTAGDTKLKLNRDFKITAYEKWNAEKENGGGYEPIEASQITEIGTYRLTLTGQKNYQGEVYAEFRVVDKAHNIENAKIQVQAKDYTGREIMLTPGTAEGSELRVYFDSQSPLVYDTDYTVVYDNNIKAGKKAKVTIIGKGDYAGEKTSYFTINAIDISKLAKEAFSAQITPDDTLGTTQYYTGYALKPEYTVKAVLQDGSVTNTVTLIKNTDYTISFGNNVSGKKQADGTYLATVKIKGKGNFKGTYTAAFEVTPTKLSDFNISVNTVIYNGKAQKPPITFIHKATGKTFDLKAGTAYTAVYKNTTNIG
ncbi:MAG: glycosyl hydrolase 53 family protein, partial [Lachnospiraceae bacterium]|nr:glycosyl hydrolase 53 family protein [Lachnospiraceae bacterium]